jgi:hypothetical protein
MLRASFSTRRLFVIPALIIGLYIVAGVVIYATYGSRHSRLLHAQLPVKRT